MSPLIEAMVRQDTLSSTETEVDMEAIVSLLDLIKGRFIDERVQGWVHPGTGKHHPPVSREEAERRWNACRQAFASTLVRGAATAPDFGGGMRPRLMKPKLASSHYSDPEAKAAAGLGESKANKCLQKMIQA